jgi:hypothetical protein
MLEGAQQNSGNRAGYPILSHASAPPFVAVRDVGYELLPGSGAREKIGRLDKE